MSEWTPATLADQMRDLERRLEQLERLADPAARAAAQDLVRSLLDFHHAGLVRLLAIVEQAGALTACTRDDRVVDLLLLHGLHPTPLRTRAAQALDRLRPVFGARGIEAQLMRVEGDVIAVHVRGRPDAAAVVREALATAVADAEVLVESRESLEIGPAGRFPLPLVPAR